LVGFAVTVIVTRAFLELAGYPQIGNEVLHIAHALWGGLLLFVAALLPLAWANRWAIQASALLGGVGTGLFIDEVGKFITQANDYFFPPSLSIIYGFFLLVVLVATYLSRTRRLDPRSAMYHALEGLQEALDGDLDEAEAARIEMLLGIAKESERNEIASLAEVIGGYLRAEKGHLAAAEPGYWRRFLRWVEGLGVRLGRRAHRAVITGVLILWVVLAIGYVVLMTVDATVDSPMVNLDSQVVQWRVPLVAIQVVVGGLMMVAVIAWLRGKEARGLAFGVGGFLLSLVALQLLYFYLSQFAAITATLLQLAFLLVLLAYRRWYLGGRTLQE
jgi:hypothetical protein